MLLSLRKNGLTSLFKEVRVFKGFLLMVEKFGHCLLTVPPAQNRVHTKGVMQQHAS